jgi:hypothetical protein
MWINLDRLVSKTFQISDNHMLFYYDTTENTNHHVYMNIVGGKLQHRHQWKKTKKQQAAPSKPALAPPNPMLIERASIRVGMGPSNPPFGSMLSESSDGRGLSTMSWKWAPSF